MSTAFRVDPQYPIEPEELPPTWAITALGDVVADLRPGFASGSHNEEGDGVPHLRPMNINRLGRITLVQLKYVQPTNGLRVVRGDVLFNNTNSPELVGKTAPIDLDGEWAFSNHMTRLRPPTGVSSRFLAYQLYFLWDQGYFRLRRTQHVNQASISARTLSRTVPLILAPEQEQLRIVAELDFNFERLDAAAAVLTASLEKMQDYRRSVLRRAASGDLVQTEAELVRASGQDYESGEELLARLLDNSSNGREAVEQTRIAVAGMWSRAERQHIKPEPSSLHTGQLAPLPEGWTWARVEDVGAVALGRQRAPRYHHGPDMRPYLRVANVFEDRIDTSDVYEMNFSPDEYEFYALRRGDLLLNEGQSPELVGRPAMFSDEVPGACFQNTLIRFRAHPGVSPSFALLVFRDYLHTGRFQQAAKWSTNIAHLGAGRFAKMEFPLPPLAEQERIVTEAKRCLSASDDLAEAVHRILDRIKRGRHTALKLAFTGLLVPQLERDEPAELLLQRIHRAHDARQVNDGSSIRTSDVGRAPMQRRSLVQVFEEDGVRLTPEQLLLGSGMSEDLIDNFYVQLKREEAMGRIRQEIVDDRVYLVSVEVGI